jgi:hypothetical protein
MATRPGMFMQDKVLMSPPYRARSSVGISSDGKLRRRPRLLSSATGRASASVGR